MKFLLDTNVCIAVMRGQAAAVNRLSARAPGECAVSVDTTARRRQKLPDALRSFIESVKI